MNAAASGCAQSSQHQSYRESAGRAAAPSWVLVMVRESGVMIGVGSDSVGGVGSDNGGILGAYVRHAGSYNASLELIMQ
jgi:hypothetical protein